MKPQRYSLLVLALVAALGCASVGVVADAQAKPHATSERVAAKEARVLLDRAVDYLKKNGPNKAFAAFNDRKGTFVNGEYYVFAIGLDGMSYANGGSPTALVGLKVLDMRDAAGKPLFKEMIDTANVSGAGVVDYQWRNPADNRIENKTSQFRKVGNYIVGVGYYLPRATAEQAQNMLDKAVALLQKSGGNIAFTTFNNPESGYVRDDLYVFAVGLDDAKFRAHGAAPSLTGMDARELRDAAGKPLIQDMIALAKDKGSGTVDYVWRNPVTNAVEAKHTRIQRVGDVLVGVGYYTK